MNEEIIRITIDYVLGEVKKTKIQDYEGLCYYFSQNIMAHLKEQGIDVAMYNIRGLSKVDYDHYFLIADGFLIDPSYSQFLPKEGELRFFKQWPAEVLAKTEEGRKILDSLLNEGYFEINDNIDKYINSFTRKEKSL